ncbi:MAG: hypothetical protein E7448_08405 [Ruminococcaceae bacterium]|nr:hypothetical protein [Oscillospiraceae bacterium]
MVLFADLAILLNFAVDLCLLLGTNRLCGYDACWKRALPAAVLGGIYGMLCILPGMRFLGNFLWRIVILAIMSVIAFGSTVSGLRRGIVFVFLSMALGGVAMLMGQGGFWGIMASAAVVCILCFAGFRMPIGQTRYVPVQLVYRGKRREVTAMLDTGNLLRDPLTGQLILLLGADVGRSLAGLTELDLTDPVGAVQGQKLPGARLIPYRTVSKGSGMLLALYLDEVWVNGRQVSRLVAFAPDVLCRESSYQALVGGVL